MLNRSASLAMSTNGLKALPCKLDIKRHSPSILYLTGLRAMCMGTHREKLTIYSIAHHSYFLSFKDNLRIVKRQFNDLGCTIAHVSVTYITSSMS